MTAPGSAPPTDGDPTRDADGTPGAVPPAAVEEYLRAARAGDLDGARAVAIRLLDRGVPMQTVVVDLLFAAQREVGERWVRNQWTVADEHQASAYTQRVLDAVAGSVQPVPADRGHVVVACAEGDWHALPAQAVAEVLRAEGWDVGFLGASTSAAALAAHLDQRPARMVAVSCSMPLYYPGVRALARVAHEHGIPVLAGGHGLGTDDRRARLLGADTWAPTVTAAVETADRWEDQPPSALATAAPAPASAVRLEAEAPALARRALAAVDRRYRSAREYDDARRERIVHYLEHLVRCLAAAVDVGDPEVLREFVGWLATLMANRGFPETALHAGIAAMAEVLAPVDPAAAALMEESL